RALTAGEGEAAGTVEPPLTAADRFLTERRRTTGSRIETLPKMMHQVRELSRIQTKLAQDTRDAAQLRIDNRLRVGSGVTCIAGLAALAPSQPSQQLRILIEPHRQATQRFT